MIYFKCMAKLLKFSIASILTACVAVATVICCCAGPTVMAHLHKKAMCGHCKEKAAGHSSNPAQMCQSHLTDAEALAPQSIAGPEKAIVYTHTVAAKLFIPTVLYQNSLYPRGSPPLAAARLPLYLQTHSLRI